jgi:hypothetical protein
LIIIPQVEESDTMMNQMENEDAHPDQYAKKYSVTWKKYATEFKRVMR